MRSILGVEPRCSSWEVTWDVVCLALLINLACDRGAACILGEPRGIRVICRRAFITRDPLLMKFLRNLSQWEELRLHFVVRIYFNSSLQFQDYLPDLVSAILALTVNLSPSGHLTSDNDEDEDSICVKFQHDVDRREDSFSLECLGLLANLETKEIDFGRIINELELLNWIKQEVLAKVDAYPYINEDVVLETIRLIATVCVDLEAAKLLVFGENSVIPRLIHLINRKLNKTPTLSL